jgi:hypothetical protein
VDSARRCSAEIDAGQSATAARTVIRAVALSLLLFIAARPALSQTEAVLYNFTSPPPKYGGDVTSPLTPDGKGDYFGTTCVGGEDYGTIYELSPNGSAGWKETVIHTFTNEPDGAYPQFTPLIFDKDGNLYGETQEGGTYGDGTAFKFTRAGDSWVESILWNFGPGGSFPFNSLIMDSAGNLYGTDNYYGVDSITEAVFELSPAGGSWNLSIIYDVDVPAADDGGGGLVMDGAGNIFGISSGLINPAIVFELTPNGEGGWNETTLYTFGSLSLYPQGAPVLDKHGNLYGTTMGGGDGDNGTVFELRHSKAGDWSFDTLYAFKGGPTDGSGPYAGIAFDAAGNIYGNTMFGGPSNMGTVFELLTADGKGPYQEKILVNFDGNNGSEPMSPVIVNSAGTILGTTTQGGTSTGTECYGWYGCGVAFEVSLR